MFKKKPNFKSFAPLRSSDRRKLIDQIIKQYDLEVPQGTDEDNGETSQPSLSALRNIILPDGSSSVAFTTTVGPNLRTYKGTVYVGSHPEDQQRVLWVKLEDGMLMPTVYTLWKFPNLLPILHTPSLVVEKMREGADLNTPGLAGGPPFPAKATKGAIVAISSCERSSVPTVVGVCEINVSALTEVHGQKGHAVKPLHYEGDELWSWAPNGKSSGIHAPEHIEDWLHTASKTAKSSTGSQDSVDGSGLAKKLNKIDIDSANATKPPENQDEGEDVDLHSREWSTNEIDAAFHRAFLYALYEARNETGNSSRGLQFPISQSQFITNLITPYLPIFSSADAAALQIKKTSWKNVKKFIKKLDKEMLLKSKDRNGGETVILDVDYDDPAVLEFSPYRLPKKTKGLATGGGAAVTAPSGKDDSVGQQLTRVVLLRPGEKLTSIVGDKKTRSLLQVSELKAFVTKFIEDEALINSGNKRLVSLNPYLANTIFGSGTSKDNEVVAKGVVARDVLSDRAVALCSPYWTILRNDESYDESKAKSGKIPSIKIMLETRSGNKTATKVWGLEPYHIRAHDLADELQKICASSTTVAQVHGTSPKTPSHEVMVQGPQKDAIVKALEKRGVKKDWVEVMDKTKGKKK